TSNTQIRSIRAGDTYINTVGVKSCLNPKYITTIINIRTRKSNADRYNHFHFSGIFSIMRSNAASSLLRTAILAPINVAQTKQYRAYSSLQKIDNPKKVLQNTWAIMISDMLPTRNMSKYFERRYTIELSFSNNNETPPSQT